MNFNTHYSVQTLWLSESLEKLKGTKTANDALAGFPPSWPPSETRRLVARLEKLDPHDELNRLQVWAICEDAGQASITAVDYTWAQWWLGMFGHEWRQTYASPTCEYAESAKYALPDRGEYAYMETRGYVYRDDFLDNF